MLCSLALAYHGGRVLPSSPARRAAAEHKCPYSDVAASDQPLRRRATPPVTPGSLLPGRCEDSLRPLMERFVEERIVPGIEDDRQFLAGARRAIGDAGVRLRGVHPLPGT
jgi:hypothetical protein